MSFEAVIGLEIHAELRTKTKMFCNTPNDPDEKHPNINVCPVCMAHPGTLPTINMEAVRQVLRVGLALKGEISEISKFDRKNYFYPDLPKGYQISQYDLPLVKNGNLDIDGSKIRIRRIHLEEDTGRLQHAADNEYSLVDFNRAGIPLMELVTEPDIRSGSVARRFCEELQLILRYLRASEANMQKGEMRCEVNISLRQKGAEHGTKVEIKNLNSFRAVEHAVDYEINRQTEILENGKKVIQETRGWDENEEITFSQRVKEEAHDYRYFPEPDLPALRISSPTFDLKQIQNSLPELPAAKRLRFKHEFGLPAKDIEIFVREKPLADYFEAVVSELARWMRDEGPREEYNVESLAKIAANYCITELQKILRENEVKIEHIRITPENFAELVKMIARREISSSAAQAILSEMFHSGADPSVIADDKNLKQVSDESVLARAIDKVLEANSKAVEDYHKGKTAVLQFLVGMVMKETKGSANPGEALRILRERLKKPL